MLKDEIGESALRLKAAKFGHTIEEIAPAYENTFYLPDQSKFQKPLSQSRVRESVFEKPLSTSVVQGRNNFDRTGA